MNRFVLQSAAIFALAAGALPASGFDMLTFHNDNQRSGANTTETILKQSNVNSGLFGKLYARNVDGIMYTQPLYASAISIAGGTHNVVFVGTMHDSVYAFDADNPNQPAYWHVSMGTPVPYTDVYTNGDMNMFPEIGVLSTPVIDKASSTIYLVAMTKEGPNSYAHRLHALDLATGAEKFGGPVLITTPPIAGSSAVFSSFRQGQRPALLLANGSIYIGFAAFGDLSPYWGWELRYSAATLAQQNVFNANPANVNGLGSGIWQSGCGPGADAAGNVYLVTGNSNQGGGHTGVTSGNYSETLLKFGSTGLAVADYFTPSDVDGIDGSDADFGGGGHLLLPDQPGSKPHLIVAAGKNGQLYVLDRDNLTHYLADNDARIVQKIGIGSNKSTPVFWNSPTGPHVFVQNEGSGNLLSFSVAVNANLGYAQLTQDHQTTFGFQTHQMALSSNGSTAGTGIVWTWSGTGGDLIHQGNPPLPATLRAFNAETLVELYNSGQAANGRDTLGGFAKYNTATVANGKVYVPMTGTPSSNSQLVVYGLLIDTTPPTLTSVSAINNNTRVVVQFSKVLDPVTAQTAANYAINQGVTVSSATLGADQMTVTLTTSTLATGLTYTLTVNNVKDTATSPNTIAPNSQQTFTYQIIPPTVSISAPNTGATFSAPATVGITALATAASGSKIAKVDFFINGSLSGTATAAPYTLTLTGVAAGNYSLTAKASDDSAISTTSAPVSITVNAGTGAPYGLTTRPGIGPYLNNQLPSLSSGNFPPTLNAVGAFSDPTTLAPLSGLLQYGVNTPLWSDNALKSRWMAIPNNGSPFTSDQQIAFSPTGEWTFPNGSVFVKHFDLGTDDTNPAVTRRLETRFIVRSADGGVYGVTYKWRPDNSDADLVSSAGLDENITIATAGGTRTQTWHYPSRTECLTCHTANSGGVLGVKTRQLNGNLAYSATGVTDNQLRALNHVGIFNPVLQEASIPSYSALVPVSSGSASLELRSRSYLDANCSFCHRPGGTNALFDARFDTPLASQNLIYGNVVNNLGIAGAKVVVPQDLTRSLLYQRPDTLTANKMPPLAHNLIDANAVSTIAQWIGSLPVNSGDVIGVQFEDLAANGNGGNNIVTGTAGVVPRAGWNTETGSTGTNVPLKDAQGLASGATVSWAAADTWSNGGMTTGGNDSLLKGYLDNNGDALTTATVSGLTFGDYDVYVYVQGDGRTSSARVWVKATAAAKTDSGFIDVPYANAFAGTLNNAATSNPANYCVFKHLSSSTLVVTVTSTSGQNGDRGPLNGFQIVPNNGLTVPISVNDHHDISVDFVGQNGQTAMGAGELAGIYPRTNWQSAPGAASTGSGLTNLQDEGGTATTAAVTWTANDFWSNGGTPDTAGNQRMMKGYIEGKGDGATATFAITGLPPTFAQYDVYLYTDTDTLPNAGTYALSGATMGNALKPWQNNANFAGSFIESLNGGNGNCIVFRGVSGTSFTVTGTVAAGGNRTGFDGFQIIRTPAALNSLSPSSGDVAGGTLVTVTGLSLARGATFTVGGVAASGYNYANVPNSITLTTPAASSTKIVDVVYTGANGTLTLPNAFTYTSATAPTITAVALSAGGSAQGTTGGGAALTVTGTNFKPGASVKIGGSNGFAAVNALNVGFVNSTTLTCTSPASSPPGTIGFTAVTVTNTDNNSASLANGFQYITTPPSVTPPLSPNQGATAGGNTVRIDGANFSAMMTVSFGGVLATGVLVNGTTSLTCTVPPSSNSALGPVDVIVSDGRTPPTNVTLQGAYTYVARVPEFTSTSGKIPGVCAKFFTTANGTGVIPTTGPATFDALLPYLGKMVAANTFAGPNSSAGPGTILNLIPANSTNVYAKVSGYIRVVTPGLYTFYTASDDGSLLYFGTTPATTSLVVSNNISQGVTERAGQINLAAGLHQFTLLYTQGGGGYGLSASYSGPDSATEIIIPDSALFSDPAPAIASVSPATGSTGGNTPITLTGSGFVAGANVTINGQQALNVNVASTSSITCITPGGPSGGVNVVVVNPNGNADSVAFTYDPAQPRLPDNPPGAVAGTFFRFYSSGVSGTDPGGPLLPAFGNFTPWRTGSLATAAYLPEGAVTYPAIGTDGFSLQYSGYLAIPSDGTYNFYTASDDGSAMYIGGTQVVANNNSQGVTCRTGAALKLKAGLHKYTVQFAQGNGGFGNYIGWGSADATPAIPVDTGTPHGGAPTTQIPAGAYFYVPPTWTAAGSANWSAAANWNTDTGLGAFAPLCADSAAEAHVSLVLRFPAVGTSPYTSNNDGGSNLPVNVLELSSAVSGNAITGNQLQFEGTAGFRYGALTQPNILQLGSGAATIATPIFVRDSLNLGGDGAGVVTLSGALSNYTGGGADIKNLSKSGASVFTLAGDASGFTLGTLTVSAGTLGLNSTLNAASASIAAGGQLRGTGALAGAVTVAGMLFPGDVASKLTNDPKGTLIVAGADFSGSGGTLRARVWLKDSTHVEADKLILASPAVSALKLGGTSKLDLRVEVPGGVTTVNNLDVELVHGGDNANNTYSSGFGSVALSYGAPVANLSVLYVNKNFQPNTGDTVNVAATQFPGQAPSPPLTTNSFNRIFVRFNNAVTPVKVDAFTATADGAGVLLEWHVVSEYQNAGYNFSRRDGPSDKCAWTRVNPALLAGRLTHPGARIYRCYDWPGPGAHEYRLESIDLQGVPEHFAQLARIDCDVFDQPLVPLSEPGLTAALANIAQALSVQRTAALTATLAAAQKDAPSVHARIVRVDRNTDPALLRELGFGAAPVGAADAAVNPRSELPLAPRWFTPVNGSGGRSVNAAKALYAGQGIVRILQSALPNGFDPNFVSIKQGGLSIPALAASAAGVTLFGPGYADEYTDKDAFFLTSSTAPTAVLPPVSAIGLFDGAAQNSFPATATVEYHDVYFDWSLRPYTYPPWFSAQYLTDSSTQAFTVRTPGPTSDPATLTLNLWSLTGGGPQSPEHALNAFVNGVPVGNATWDGGGMALALTFTIPPGTLRDGANTLELVTPTLPNIASQIVFVRSLSIRYSQALNAGALNPAVAVGGLEVYAPGGRTAVYELNGLSTPDVWIVDARFPDRPRLVAADSRRQNDGSFTLRFSAPPGGTGKYWVALKGQELAPLSVTRRTLKPIDARAKYVAVGPAQFSLAMQPLLARRGKEGLRPLFVDQEQLFDYYGFGRYGPEPIRKAMQSLRPDYLLLVGRSTYDYRNYGGANVDPLCPTFLISTSFWAQATSDAGFADFGKGYPELSVGRFPVNDAIELHGAVQHTLNYAGPHESAWRGQITADQPEAGAGDFAAESDSLAANVPSVAWTKNYLNPPGNDQPAATAAMQAAAGGNADLLVYVGHGNAAHLGLNAPHLLDTISVQSWSGNTVFLQSTCTANWFAKDEANYRSIAIQALTQPQGGIAASLATTTYCSSPPAVDFMEKLLLQAGGQRRWGAALLQAQQYAWRQSQTVGGETGQWYADLAKTECLLGDPALPISAPPSSGTTQSAAPGK